MDDMTQLIEVIKDMYFFNSAHFSVQQILMMHIKISNLY